MLGWTGERYLPFIDTNISGAEIHYEHLHRYAFAAQFVKEKKVLDLASGEGYGSYMLSKEANCVVGVEIDRETVTHASSKYQKDNLEFRQGSILEVPIEEEKIFDVIVCFEAIEHVKEHDKLLSEVKRLLTDDGLFIVSTPDKRVYTDEPDYHNPFHVKELYVDEFKDLLHNYFLNTYFFGQRVYTGSNIWSLSFKDVSCYNEFLIEKDDQGFSFKDENEKTPLYLIAVASNADLGEHCNIKSYFFDTSNILLTLATERAQSLDHEIAEMSARHQEYQEEVDGLAQTVSERDCQISVLDDQLSQTTERAQVLEHEIAEMSARHQASLEEVDGLAQTISERDRQVSVLNDQLSQTTERAQVLEHEIAEMSARHQEYQEEVSGLAQTVSERDRQISALDDRLSQTTERAQALEHEIAEMSARHQESLEEVSGLVQTVSERDSQISALDDRLSQMTERAQSLDHEIAEMSARHQEYQEEVGGLTQTVSERDRQISALGDQLLEAMSRAQSLDHEIVEMSARHQESQEEVRGLAQTVSERDRQISALDDRLSQMTERAQVLEHEIAEITARHQESLEEVNGLAQTVSERDRQVLALNDRRSQARWRAQVLGHEIAEMQRSIVWHIVMRYHNGFVERALPHGTGRRRRYDLGLKGGRILVNEGWGCFWWNFKEYTRKRIRGKSGSSTIVAPAFEYIPEHSEECLWNTNPKRYTGKAFIQMNKVDMVADKEEIRKKLGDIIEEIGREL